MKKILGDIHAAGLDMEIRGPMTPAVLRGGRMTKQRGEAASFSPDLGLTATGEEAASPRRGSAGQIASSALRWGSAPIAILASGFGLAAPAAAQDACAPTGPGVFSCDDDGAAATTSQVIAGGDVTVRINDGFEVDTTGVGGDGLNVTGAGSVLVRQISGTSSITGDEGVVISNTGADGTRIDAGGTITGTAGAGLSVSGSGSSVRVNTFNAIVVGTTDGINAQNTGGGSLFIDAGAVTSAGGAGIYGRNSGVDLRVTTLSGAINGGAGIDVVNSGSGQLIIRTADVTGATGAGITATQSAGANGQVSIDTTGATVSGATDGIVVANSGNNRSFVSTGSVLASNGIGVDISNAATTTDLLLNTIGGPVSGTTGGVRAANGGSGRLSIITADVTAANGTGISASNAGTDLSIDSSAGSVSGGDYGIYASNAGTGTLSITTGNVVGSGASGIFAYQQSGGAGLTIDTSGGSVTGSYNGIIAGGFGSGDMLITTGDVTGGNGTGVYGYQGGAGTDLTIDTSAGTVSGATNGVYAQSYGAGALSITTGAVTALGGNAITAIAQAGTNGIAITTSGDVAGSALGIYALNNGSAPTVIVNDGSVTADTFEAIRTRGAGSQITNNGAITGFVSLSDADDTLTNNGAFNAVGDSTFGAGSDTLTNNGTFAVGSAGPVSLIGLETFANNGLIDLVDGNVGNNLAIDGNFVGAGNSALNVDVDFQTGLADTLTISGAATGSILVSVNPVGGQPAGLISETLVVDAGAGTSATAFDLSSGSQVVGLVEFDLTFDPTGNDFFLASAPSTAALEFGTFAETMRNVWTQSANAFSDQMTAMRDGSGSDESNVGGGEKSTRAWLTGFGSSLERDQVRNTVFNTVAGTHNLGYDQDFWGFLAGIDFGSSAVRYGVTAGYQRSDVEFAGTANGIDYDVFSVGAYLTADIGAFWANALAKYDDINGTLESTTAGLTASVDGSVLGIQAEAGALIGDRRALFLEPSVSFAYASADLDDVGTMQGDFAFDAGDSALGKIGARAGTGFDLGGTSGVLFVGGHYVHEFDGDDTTVAFASGPNPVLFGNLPFDDYAEITGGITIGNEDDAISGSLQGHFITGDDLEGYGGSLNIRFRF